MEPPFRGAASAGPNIHTALDSTKCRIESFNGIGDSPGRLTAPSGVSRFREFDRKSEGQLQYCLSLAPELPRNMRVGPGPRLRMPVVTCSVVFSAELEIERHEPQWRFYQHHEKPGQSKTAHADQT